MIQCLNPYNFRSFAGGTFEKRWMFNRYTRVRARSRSGICSNLLLKNYHAKFDETLHECSLDSSHIDFSNNSIPCVTQVAISGWQLIGKAWKSSCMKLQDLKLWNLVCSTLEWTLTEIIQIISLGLKLAKFWKISRLFLSESRMPGT